MSYKRYNLAIVLILLFIPLLYIHGFRELEFPTPWNDETAFLSQAYSFYKNNNLYSEGLHPLREIMWMPPGYPLFIGCVFKITGYEWWIPKILSGLFLISAWIVTLKSINKILIIDHFTILSLIFFYYSPYNLIIGNLARMESLFVLIISLGLYFFISKRFLASFSLIIFSSLIHFNAIYFMIPFLFIQNYLLIRIKKFELLVFVITLFFVLSYLTYILINLNGFLEDMIYQFKFKNLIFNLNRQKNYIIQGILILSLIFLFKLKSKYSIKYLAVFGICFLLINSGNTNMFYEYSTTFSGFIFFSIILKNKNYYYKLIICYLIILNFLFYFPYRKTFQYEKLIDNLVSPEKKFLSKNIISNNRILLSNIYNKKISFGYTGLEYLYFNELYVNKNEWIMMSYSSTKIYPLRKIDLRLFCDSKVYPQYLKNFDFDGFKRNMNFDYCSLVKIGNPKK